MLTLSLVSTTEDDSNTGIRPSRQKRKGRRGRAIQPDTTDVGAQEQAPEVKPTLQDLSSSEATKPNLIDDTDSGSTRSDNAHPKNKRRRRGRRRVLSPDPATGAEIVGRDDPFIQQSDTADARSGQNHSPWNSSEPSATEDVDMVDTAVSQDDYNGDDEDDRLVDKGGPNAPLELNEPKIQQSEERRTSTMFNREPRFTPEEPRHIRGSTFATEE